MKKEKHENLISQYTFQTKGVWRNFAGLILLSILQAVVGVLNAASLKLLLDIAAGESSVTVAAGTIFALLVMAFQALFHSLEHILNVRTQNKIAGTAKARLLNHMEKAPFLELSKHHSGDLLTRISDDTDICAKVLPGIGSSILVGMASCIVSLIYAFMLSWKLAILCVLLSPLAVLWSRYMLPFVQKYAAQVRQKEGEIRSFSQEEISYIPVIKSFTSYGQSQERFQNKFGELSHTRILSATVNAILNGGAIVVGSFSFMGAAALGAYLSLKGEVTAGTIVGFIQLLNYIVWPFTEFMPLLGELQNGKAARARIREIEELPCEEEEKELDLNCDKAVLELRNLSFSYGGDGDMVLKNVDMELEGRQLVGVMGPSGCGKSTLMQLLTAIYRPTTGTICLTDGNCCVEGTSLRKYISYVPQDHLLISGTVAENIAFGAEDYKMEDVISAARQAGIHDVIQALPDRYRTQVQEKGANFSFGQAQRIAIARAIYRDAPVLILDEPTASLDAESKKIIMDTLREEAKRRLCIMVCHDQNEKDQVFDRVLKMQQGSAVVCTRV
ncbi:MAG: ABC transporter ATP-binding protein [Lachnospiraceae bacterium]|nr:ABC transporter ATP-binding protein [Lachnospiraceae bacterium]